MPPTEHIPIAPERFAETSQDIDLFLSLALETGIVARSNTNRSKASMSIID